MHRSPAESGPISNDCYKVLLLPLLAKLQCFPRPYIEKFLFDKQLSMWDNACIPIPGGHITFALNTSTLRCPDCGNSDEELSIAMERVEYVRVTYDCYLYLTEQGVVATLDGDELSTEVVDADRDSATFRCDDCCFETDDPQDFEGAPDTDESEV